MQYKNILKIKMLQLPCKFSMIFMEYLRILGTENTAGGASTRPREWRARPPPGHAPCLVGPWWPPSTYASTHTLHLLPKKNPHPAQARVLAHLTSIFDLLDQSSIHKLLWGIVLRYVTPPMVQLVFVLVLYSLQIIAAW